MHHTWRDAARPIIYRVLQANADKTEKEKRAALREAYPFGERAYHPYKIWLNEIQVQLFKRKHGKKNNVVPKEQLSMFH